MKCYHIALTGKILETEGIVLKGSEVWEASRYCNFLSLQTAKVVAHKYLRGIACEVDPPPYTFDKLH